MRAVRRCLDNYDITWHTTCYITSTYAMSNPPFIRPRLPTSPAALSKDLSPAEVFQQAATQLAAVVGNLNRHNESPSTRSRWPYYTNDAACQVAEALVQVCETRQPFLWRSPSANSRSMQIKWRQGLRYLLDHLDEAGDYAKLADQVSTIQMPGAGLRIQIRRSLPNHTIQRQDDNWREEFQEFLAQSIAGSTFERDMALTPQESAWIIECLDPVKQFVSHNQPNERLLRVTILNYLTADDNPTNP